MNPLLLSLRKLVYLNFNQAVKILGGYGNFKRVFSIAPYLGAFRSKMGYVGGSSRKDYLDAIRKSFPGQDEEWYRDTLRKFWSYHQMIFLELFMLDKMNSDNISELVEFEGLEHIENALARGKGAILPVPHIGNVRLLHYALALKGYSMTVVSSEYGDDPELVRRFKLEKTSSVHEVGFRGEYPRWILNSLKQNHLVQIASTAEAGKVGVDVEFLGRSLFLTSGWARLAKLSQSTVLPTYILRKPDHRHTIHIDSPFEMIDDKDKKSSIQQSIQKFLDLLEPVCCDNPAQIDWMSWMVRLKEAEARRLKQ